MTIPRPRSVLAASLRSASVDEFYLRPGASFTAYRQVADGPDVLDVQASIGRRVIW